MNRLVLGLMRGDEGKGKITDYFAKDSDIVIRYAGSCNAGHTIYRGDKKIVLHQLPSGILKGKTCIIGRGCLVDLKKLYKEVQEVNQCINEGYLEYFNDKQDFQRDVRTYLKISYGAHLIFDKHIQEDIEREDSGHGNGSTKCGIAPAYRDKYYRSGTRVIDFIHNNQFDDLVNYFNICFEDDEQFLNKDLNKNLLFEGAQGVLLDINSPYYPNVSSSSVGIDGILAGTGINIHNLLENGFEAVGVVKAYMSSVGVGKFLTQLDDEDGKKIRDAGAEYGATTGRPRKVGWLDLPLIRYAIRTSGVDSICLTRLDTLMDAFKDDGKFKVCVSYHNNFINENYYIADVWNLTMTEQDSPIYIEFPIWKKCSMDDENFKSFIEFLQRELNNKIKYLSIGKGENDIITLF